MGMGSYLFISFKPSSDYLDSNSSFIRNATFYQSITRFSFLFSKQ